MVRARGFVLMGRLGLDADPEGWLNAGYTINALMDSLEGELDDADRVGGSGLAAHWAGPVADAFTGHWGALRPRVEDLIGQGRRAASAITDFGGKVEGFVKRAAELEGYWLSFGLQLGYDGMHFALPWGFEHLPHEHQLSFRQLLDESEQDVTAMWDDIRAAVDDVVTALESLIGVFEDFAVLGLGVAAGLAGGYLGGYRTNLASLASDGLGVLGEGLDYVAPRALDAAYDMVTDASHDTQALADVATKIAVGSAKAASVVDDVVHYGGPVLYVATVGVTAWQTYETAKKAGWVNGIEDHASDWAGLAAGIAVTVLAPVDAPVLGVVLVSGIVGYGVGYGVQRWVNDNRTSINQGLTDIGHGADVTAKAVGHGAEAVGHGLEDAAEWEARHAEGLAGLL
jgi:hypothetical protein